MCKQVVNFTQQNSTEIVNGQLVLLNTLFPTSRARKFGLFTESAFLSDSEDLTIVLALKT